MSTRCTIKDARDKSAGQGFHLYEDLAEQGDCVLLDLDGMTFETSACFAPSGRPEMRVRERIPKHLAQKLGLLPDADV